MQARPYPEMDGLRIWLSRDEQRTLFEAVEDEPRRPISIQLALYGLWTDEVIHDEPRNVRKLANGANGHSLIIPAGRTEKRKTLISADLVERIKYLKSATRMRQDEDIVDVSKRPVRNWIGTARETLEDDRARLLGCTTSAGRGRSTRTSRSRSWAFRLLSNL